MSPHTINRARELEAVTVIDGATHSVEIVHGEELIAILDPDQARELAWLLEDAAFEPEHCERGDCDRYAIAYGLCDLHASRV